MTTLALLFLFLSGTQAESMPPTPTHAVFPAYPLAARGAQLEAELQAKLEIDADGRVVQASIVRERATRDAAPLFRDGVLKAARQWRYPTSDASRQTVVVFRFILTLSKDASAITVFDPPTTVEVHDKADPSAHINWGPSHRKP